MSEAISILWNHTQRKIHIVKTGSALRPPAITYEGQTYHSSGSFPGYYITPVSEEAFLMLFSIILQNLENFPSSPKDMNPLTYYDQAYGLPQQGLPENMNHYLYSDNKHFWLWEDQLICEENKSYKMFFHAFLKQLCLKLKLENSSILEIGSGAGTHLLFLKKEFPSAEIHGLEPSSSGIKVSREAAVKWGLDLHLHPHSTINPPDDIRHKRFDMVFCHSVLTASGDHGPDILKAMCGMSKRWVALIDVFPELWETGTKRTLASYTNLFMKKYTLGLFQGINSGRFNLPVKIIQANRLKSSWNPLCECSFVLLEVNPS